jgi:protein ImuB
MTHINEIELTKPTTLQLSTAAKLTTVQAESFSDDSFSAGSSEPSDRLCRDIKLETQHAGKRILCLWFPNWPIQRLVVSQPELRRKRILLFRRDSRRGQIISAASPLAMQDGACVDMPLSEAKSLLTRGATRRKTQTKLTTQTSSKAATNEFHIFEHDLDADLDFFEELADSLDYFSPIIGLETIDPREFKRGRRPDSMLLEVTGLAHLFGDESQLARELLTHCDELGYLPRIAIADTVGTAWAMARYVAGQYFAQHQQPVVLPPGDQETLKQLPVESLRLETTITDTLYQLGIETVGRLQQLPRNDLAMRFGNVIHRRLDQLTGVVEEPVVARHKPAEFVDQQLLEYPTNHRETIEVILARLVGNLCEQMRAKQRGALEWTIKLICQSGSPIEFHVNLFQPTAMTDQVMPLMEMQIEQALSPHTRKFKKRKRISRKKAARPKQTQPKKPQPSTDTETESMSSTENQFHRYTTIQVQEISVMVTSDVLLAQQQRQLFDENPRLDRQSLAHLINRLASRLGTENVVYPTLLSGAQPEYSFRLRPLVDPRRKQRRRKTKPPKQSHTLARPLRLFHPPLRLAKVEVFRGASDGRDKSSGERSAGGNRPHQPYQPYAGTDSDRANSVKANSNKRISTVATNPPPALLQIDSSNTSPQKVISSWGPERIETGWWRGHTVCRDYWRIETESHQHFWVYRNIRSGEWFLHGEF